MKTVNVHEAKTHLSRLLARVGRGEEVIIARAGKPIARLVPFAQKRERTLGFDVGRIAIAEDFDAPLPEAVLAEFEGEHPA
jgi:prevent-host-death family protein